MIIWTALPNGYSDDDRGFRLTVMVSPRLPSLALGEFANWPERIAGLKFDVVFADAAGATPFADVKPRNALDRDLWLRVFRNTTVRDASAIRAASMNSKVRSFSVRTIGGTIKDHYAIATHRAKPDTDSFVPRDADRLLFPNFRWLREAGPKALPREHVDQFSLPTTASAQRDVYRLSQDPQLMLDPTVIRLVKGIHEENGGIAANSVAPMRIESLKQALFHRRLQDHPFAEPQESDCFEFHRQLSTLLNYPALLRPLGLALDLILVAPRTSFLAATGRVAVKPKITFAPGFEPCLPWTKFEPAGSIPFHAAADADTCSGMLRLQDPDAYHLEALDVDSAAMTLAGLADSRSRAQHNDAAPDTNVKSSLTTVDTLPALRTNGISIVSNGREQKVDDTLRRAKTFEDRCATHQDIILTARDVTQGWVVDVQAIPPGAPAGEWRSLCDRDERFTIDGKEYEFKKQSGVVRPGGTKAVDKLMGQAKPPNELYVHEAFVRWTGWSLTVPRPKSIGRTGVTRSTPADCKWIETEFKAIGLPKLRFGNEYRFRARLADLAGNTLSREEAPVTCSIPPGPRGFVFRRYEPVSAPPILVVEPTRLRSIPGEQLNRLVLRDGEGRSSRCCVPPRTSQEFADFHGMFDSVGAPARGSFDAVRLNSDGEFPHDHDTGNPLFGEPGVAPQVPYYPDPLAYRARLQLVDALASAPSISPFAFYTGNLDAQWPHARRFFIVAVPIGKREHVAARWIGDTLEIALPAGREVTLRASSQFFDTASAEVMALVEIARKAPSSLAFDIAPVGAGSHGMITPREEIHLVHAVKKPLEMPEIRASIAERLPGSITVKLDFDVDVDDKSTGRIEVMGDWSEPIDDVTDPNEPTTRKGHAPVTEISRHEPPTQLANVTVPLHGIEQRFSDSKYRCIDYTAVASSRFAEYYKEKDPREFSVTSRAIHVVIPNSARPVPAISLYVLPTFGWASKGNGKHFISDRAGGGLRIYFARPWYSSGDGELAGIVLRAPGYAGDGRGITRWGIDPTYKAVPMPDYPEPDDFEGFVHVRTNVVVPLDADPAPKTVTATVIGYQPIYDRDRRLWYIDVTVKNPGAYTPFIKLSIVRFQPTSVMGLEASMVVPAEFAQLFPTRRVSVTRAASKGTLCVNVSGDALPAGESAAARFQISVDRQCIDFKGNVNWLPIPTSSAPCSESGPPDTLLSVNVSVGDVCGPLRMRIEEFEARSIDGPSGAGNPVNARRLIYADVLEL